MANVILPVKGLLSLGATLIIYTYQLRNEPSVRFENTYVERIEDGSAHYYLLDEDNLPPYADLGLPIDLVLFIKTGWYDPTTSSYDIPAIVTDDPKNDRIVLLVIAQYMTAALSVNQTTPPSSVPNATNSRLTHYAAKQIFGSRCIATLEISPGLPGDALVVRRIFQDVMGSSGEVGSDFLNLLQEALNETRKSPDVRSPVKLDIKVECKNADLPPEDAQSLEKTVENLLNLANFTPAYSTDTPNLQVPLYVSFEPLHSLDEEFPDVKIDKKAEDYLIWMDEKLHDLQKIHKYGMRVPQVARDKIFEKPVYYSSYDDVRKSLRDYVPSMYDSDFWEELALDIYNHYMEGLRQGDENYFSKFKKYHEREEMICETTFKEPTRGKLIARPEEKDEITYSETGSLEKCKEDCGKREKCRAILYDEEDPDKCTVYYVSTNTAKIEYAEGDTSKIYDRTCRFVEYMFTIYHD